MRLGSATVKIAILSFLAVISGCQVFLPAMGGEGQSCFENKTCKPGLVCEDGVCRAWVVPDAGDGGDRGDGGGVDAGDGDGFIPECGQNQTRCVGRELFRCEEPGRFIKDRDCNIGCDAAGEGCLKVLDIACGHSHTCAVLSDGRVRCWGNNDEGQLGIGTIGGGIVPPSPVYTMASVPLANVRQIEASQRTNIVLHFDNAVSCWGRNAKGTCAISPAGGSVPAATTVTSV
jgi:hypothetical protein